MALGKIKTFVRRIIIRRKHKDFLFRRVFRDKTDILALYNALNHTHYSNPDDLEITTLEDAIYMSMKNDLSFIIASTLNLYEHQSTVNPNMPIRGFLYFARLYEAFIKLNNIDIYSSKSAKLPFPQYVVFYNGESEFPDEQIIKLSDMFETNEIVGTYETVSPCLECTARVININFGHNKELLDACKKLYDYSYFVNKVRINKTHGMNLEDSINEAVDYCIENNILRELLLKNKAEVSNMLLFTYDEKLHKKTIKAEAREEGLAEGLSAGRAEGLIKGRIDAYLELVKDGEISKETAAKRLGITIEELESKLKEL